LHLAGIETPPTKASQGSASAGDGWRPEAEAVRDTLYRRLLRRTKPGIAQRARGDWKLIKYDVLDGARARRRSSSIS
jgi:hypothetical protein